MPFEAGDKWKGNDKGAPRVTPEIKIAKEIKKKAQKEIIEAYKERFFSIVEESGDKIPKKLIEKAIDGDLQAIKETNDRILGKAEQNIKGEIGVEHSGEIEINVTKSINKIYGESEQH